MKKSILGSILIFLSLLIGWILGYLRLPFLHLSSEFLIGFVLAVSLFSVLLLMFRQSYRTKRIVILFFSTLIIVSIFHFVSTERHQQKVDLLEKEHEMLMRKAQLLVLGQELDQVELVDTFLESNRSLLRSEDSVELFSVIQSLQELNKELENVEYYEGLRSIGRYSPGRGHLLKELIKMELDTTTYELLFKQVSFQHSKLTKADFKGAYFSGIDLSNSHLLDADLSFSILSKSNLDHCSLNHSNLKGAMLDQATLNQALMLWCELEGINLENGSADGTDLSNSFMENSNLKNASFKWAIMKNVKLNHSDLSNSIVWTVDFENSELKNVKLDKANLVDAKLNHVILEGASLDQALVNEGFFDRLKKQKVVGSDAIQESYSSYFDSYRGYPRLSKK